MNENELVKEYRNIKKDYSCDLDIMSLEDDRVRRTKFIIQHRLSVADRTILLLYVDCQSYRKLGAKMGVSHATIRNEVIRIKQIILEELTKERNNV